MLPQSETGILLLSIAKGQESFARLVSAAQASSDPKERRLYNQLALEELSRLVMQITRMDDLADGWLSQVDLSLPLLSGLPDSLPQIEAPILEVAPEEEGSQVFRCRPAEGEGQEELLSLLDHLCTDEENHQARLFSMLDKMEVHRRSASDVSVLSDPVSSRHGR